MFADRHEAGEKLAEALRPVAGAQTLVLGLPRGGVVVAAVVARVLQAEWDVVLVKKLRAPGNPELALGAVAEDGLVHLNHDVARLTGATESYILREQTERLQEMRAQAAAYRAVHPRIDVSDRTVVLVDDGLATGATMLAAVQCTALGNPARLLVAVPVSPCDTAQIIAQLESVDQFVCLETPSWFGGVGQFYGDFAQVPDQEVVRLLREAAR